MVEFTGETPPTDENAYMWEQCKKLYRVITQNGKISAEAFRMSTQMAGGMFKAQIDMNPVIPWFSAMADFIEWVERAMAQKGETV